jgi:hypothetical protein
LKPESLLDLALSTLVQVYQGKLKAVTPRDRVAAANALLDRRFGRPTQSIDMMLPGKRCVGRVKILEPETIIRWHRAGSELGGAGNHGVPDRLEEIAYRRDYRPIRGRSTAVLGLR